MNKIFDLTGQELLRQKNTLNLIASENYPSPKVLQLLGSIWSNKYGEGYPGKRFYAGNIFTDELESFVQQKALEVFDTQARFGSNNQNSKVNSDFLGSTLDYDVNVQVLSGSPANSMVYLAMLESGDTILSMSLANGGHLSHLHKTSNWNKFFGHAEYDVKEIENNCYEIDEEDFENKLKEFKPKLTILGGSSYPRIINFAKLIKIAHQHGSLVLADIAHISGLIASNLHPTPFASDDCGADFVTTTTHKTFRGPRSALLFCKKAYTKLINKTVFPGTSGGPHFNQIAATGQACIEILGQDFYPDKIDFQTYTKNLVDNTKTLENSLAQSGLEITSPTQNHLCLVKLPTQLDSLEIQQKLENLGIICNRNVVPFDTKTAWRPSGLRLGMAALTSRGMDENQTENLGKIIAELIFEKDSQENLQKQVQDLVSDLDWWY